MSKKEDLGLKFGTKESKPWHDLKEKCTTEMQQCELMIECDKHLMALCESKIKELEKDLYKK